jgi:hypothetical protein
MAKKKIKKFLKKVAPLAALALGATALGRRKQNKTYLDEEGGARSDMRNYGPFSNEPNYVPGPSKYVRSKTVLGAPGIDRIQDYYKKGGRVGCGIAKKGFGRAMKKGGKK